MNEPSSDGSLAKASERRDKHMMIEPIVVPEIFSYHKIYFRATLCLIGD